MMEGSKESQNHGEDASVTGVVEGSSSQVKKGDKKKRKLNSGLWVHFKMLPLEETEGILKCACIKCGQRYNAGSERGTGNLHRHVERCIKTTNKEIDQYMIVADENSALMSKSTYSQEKFRELVVHAIIRHNLPFFFIEYDAIWNVFKYLEPGALRFSRNTAKADVNKIYMKEFNRLFNKLDEYRGRISLTSDARTSIVTDGYICLTAHYIDKNWNLQKRILNFSYMPSPHTGLLLSEKLYALLSSWGIEGKLFSITLDNALSNDACVGLLRRQLLLNNGLLSNGNLFHVRCCAHILSLIVQDGLKEIDISVEKVRECVKYVKGSQGRNEKFNLCIEQSSLNGKKGLLQYVPTRWNSTYKMLASALYYRLAFEILQVSDSNFRSCPTSEEWEKIEKICVFLSVFYSATTAFSGTLYPTSNLYFPQVFMIQVRLVEESMSSDLYMSKIAGKMLDKFQKYWAEFNVLLAIAVVFDPRYKFQMLEFSYERLYGADSNELAKVKDTLFSLFGEYEQVSSFDQRFILASKNRRSNDEESLGVGSSNVLQEFRVFQGKKLSYGNVRKSQLELYLDEPMTDIETDLEVLHFWKSQEYRYPDLAKLARDILAIPVSTVASESAFSFCGRILDHYRSSLAPNIVEALICCRNWLFGSDEAVIEDFKANELIKDILDLKIGGGDGESEVTHV